MIQEVEPGMWQVQVVFLDLPFGLLVSDKCIQ